MNNANSAGFNQSNSMKSLPRKKRMLAADVTQTTQSQIQLSNVSL